MRDIEAACPTCGSPIPLSLGDFSPLQFGSKLHPVYCDRCNKPSILKLRSRLAATLTLLAFVIATVFVVLKVDNGSAASVVLVILGPLTGMAVGSLVGSLIPSLVAKKAGT